MDFLEQAQMAVTMAASEAEAQLASHSVVQQQPEAMPACLQSPRMGRARTRPNLQVTQGQYMDALARLFVAEAPVLDMRSKLGPTLAKHPKQVTPGHLVSLEKLWYP